MGSKRCAYCEKPLRRSKNKFCDGACAARHNRNRLGTGAPNPGCVRCGRPVKRHRSSYMFNKYCDQCIDAGHHLPFKDFDKLRTNWARKSRLLKERGHGCEGCGRRTWLSNPIPLDLDHINGDSDDNTRENLRLICPNCHAGTPTYKAKNRGKGCSRQAKRRRRYAEGKTY